MAKITFHGDSINTVGDLPTIGTLAPDFDLVKSDLSELKLSSLKGKNVVLNIFPSIDTGVCATSVRKFNKEAGSLNNTTVLCVSADLPFAAGRFCGAEGLENVITLSTFRDNNEFANQYGVLIEDRPLKGLLARAVVVLDTDGKVVYNELVPEIAQEPDYDSAINSIV